MFLNIISFLTVFFTSFYSSMIGLIPGIQTINQSNSQISYEQQTESQEPEPRIIYYTEIVDLETVVYNQLGGNIYSSSGCGPTCAAMLLSSETDTYISKDKAVITAYDNNYYYDAGVNLTSGQGVTQENIQDLFKIFGYESQIDHLWNNSDNEIIEKINDKISYGHRLIVGHCTTNGSLHYAVIYGKYLCEDVYYYKIADPWQGVTYEWNQYSLLNHLNTANGNDDTTFNGLVKGIQWLV